MPAVKRTRLTRSARPELAVVLHGTLIGHVYRSANRRLVLSYDDGWRTRAGAFPLSLSMPLDAREHGHQATFAFLSGLLPDDPKVVEYWARLHGVSRNDVVKLLAFVGEDCAGAVQLVRPEEIDRVLGAATAADAATSIEWLSTHDVAELLASLRRNPAAGRSSAEQGQFSLAGAQPKTTLYYERGRWGIPKGRVPSTHILKPPVLDLEDLAYNEHFCLHLARELGMSAAISTVQLFGDQIAIVVERYDRTRSHGTVRRVHQEDMCQALAVQPTRKYESDGGPALTDITALLAQHSSDASADIARFFDANILNWLVAGPDAHAKNYSILHAEGPDHRFAPLYDVITALPYPRLTKGGATLAMAVGGERTVAAITGNHWRAAARAVELPADLAIDRIVELGERMPAAIERVIQHPDGNDDTRAIMTRLAEPLADHVKRCLKRL
ncbi:MAG TPA: type II toxin-antitoxin system HipA family toxin [Gemmatimonadaceae bacterium]|nr:type II toxin-antitoxin system HipA family toxin [Gemmatimonadaceae bacterium]